MSLSGALLNAFSGLRANSQAAALVSANISNATTEGYGARTLALGSGAMGTAGGVNVLGVVRQSDPVITSDRMVSDANYSESERMLDFAARLESFVGESGALGSLTGRLTAFENALVTAASNPASAPRLDSALVAAQDFASALNTLSDQVQDMRSAADARIGAQVSQLNSALVRLEELNDDIVTSGTRGVDVSPLLDERQTVLNSVAEIVPLRVIPKDRGTIAVYTTGGAVLLDGLRSEIGFDPASTVAAEYTIGAQLSGLTINGFDLGSDGSGLFAGGSMAADFNIRDEIGVERQAQLDGLARDLIERLGPGGPDATLAVGDAGFFTDGGLAFNPANEVGLSGRLSLNALIAPGSGDSWRLRDGLGAVGTGDVGDASLIQGIASALTTAQVPGSAALNPTARSFSDRIADFSSDVSAYRVRVETENTYQSAQNTALTELELSKGVDTDLEIQRLMLIEQHYSANAQVMSVVDELMERLMAI